MTIITMITRQLAQQLPAWAGCGGWRERVNRQSASVALCSLRDFLAPGARKCENDRKQPVLPFI